MQRIIPCNEIFDINSAIWFRSCPNDFVGHPPQVSNLDARLKLAGMTRVWLDTCILRNTLQTHLILNLPNR